MNITFRNLKQRIFFRISQKSKLSIAYYVILTLGILVNVVYAIFTPDFFHPDEIYQTLEVAHKFVYGYGYLSWEWKKSSFYLPNDPVGYGQIRSLLTPLIFSIFFIIGNILQLNYWNGILPMIRIILAINFLTGLYLASKIIQELNPDKTLPVDKFFFVIALFYHDTIFYSSKTLTNTLVASFVFFALYIWIKKFPIIENQEQDLDNEEKSNDQDKIRKYYDYIEVFAGFLVGLAIWIRPDSAVFMGIFVLLFIQKIELSRTINFAIGFILSAIIDGWLDFLYYGKFFITFINFLKFNLKYPFFNIPF